MTFSTDVQQEYDEMMGENEDDETEEKSKESTGEVDFEDLITDIKKDLKKIPKEDVWPAFPDSSKRKEEKSEVVEESEFDISDAKKAFQPGEQKKKPDKKCRVGDKIYDVGNTWIDEVTGKDMICILMNIPKDVQPTLADADIAFTADPEPIPVEETPQWNRPSVEPQWSYTAYPSKKTGQIKPIKEKCVPDEEAEKITTEQPNTEVDESNQLQNEPEETAIKPEEDGENYVNSKEREDLLPNEKEDSTKPIQNLDNLDLAEPTKQKPEQSGDTLREPEVKTVDKLEPSEDTDESTDDDLASGSEYEVSKNKISKVPESYDTSKLSSPQNKAENNFKTVTRDNGDEIKKDKPVQEDNINQKDSQGKSNESKEKEQTSKVQATNETEDQLVTPTQKVGTEDKSHSERKLLENRANDDHKKEIVESRDHLESVHVNKNDNLNTEDLANEDKPPAQESGQQIFMKETVVKHRKLLRTEETIETIETNKNGK